MQLRFQRVSLRGLGTALPEDEISSHAIEERLAPTYRRLGLVPGRLELMTGIRARRHFPAGTLPSDIAVRAAEDLFSRLPAMRKKVDCLIHASVCRDFVEPATATVVHHRLELSPEAMVFDLSNACLSAMNAVSVGAGLIECGQAGAVLVVSGEDARTVVDTTIRSLNADASLTRRTIKPSLASLTLGSGGVAMLLTRSNEGGAPLLGGAFRGATQFHSLCQAGAIAQSGELPLTMETDSEKMLVEGVKLAVDTWREARAVLGWEPSTLSAYFSHQVGSAHRGLMQKELELDPAKDFSTFEVLGNMGAASVGVTLALGARAGRLREGDPFALLGIGSGLVCGMLGWQWSHEVAV